MLIYALDDMKTHADIYRGMFAAEAFTEHGPFLTTLCNVEPDLFICDLMMPHIDGWTIAGIARQIYPELPIIIATSLDDSVQRVCAERKGYFFWQ